MADSARLDDFLRDAGFEILGGTVLFRLARHAAAPAFVQRLAREGIHVRAFAHRPTACGLPGDARPSGDWQRLSAFRDDSIVASALPDRELPARSYFPRSAN